MASTMVWDAMPASADVDMQMHLASVDVEPWEASMDADGELDLHADSDSVEIDMEEYSASNEFEMAQDDHVLQPDADVELQDVSALASPAQPAVEETDAQVIDLTSEPDNDVPLVETSDYLDQEPLDEISVLPVDHDAVVPDSTEQYSSIENHVQEHLSDLTPVPEPSTEVYSQDPSVALGNTPQLPTGEEAESGGPTSQVQQTPEQEVENVQVSAEDHAPAEDTTAQEVAYADEPALNELVGETDPIIQNGNPSDETESQHHSEGEDPIEIGEGIYIDPPPGVLLWLPSDDQGIYIFNHPPTGSSTPVIGDPRPTRDLQIILQHLPTIYYQPLSNLFEALREDNLIASIPHLSESELFLEALDLDLSISEDNIHARDVSIHDMNRLHDGLGFSGALKLRLRLAPRFILRYRTLEADVNRLAIQEAGTEQDAQEHDPDESEDNLIQLNPEQDEDNNEVLPEQGDNDQATQVLLSETSQPLENTDGHFPTLPDPETNNPSEAGEGSPLAEENQLQHPTDASSNPSNPNPEVPVDAAEDDLHSVSNLLPVTENEPEPRSVDPSPDPSDPVANDLTEAELNPSNGSINDPTDSELPYPSIDKDHPTSQSQPVDSESAVNDALDPSVDATIEHSAGESAIPMNDLSQTHEASQSEDLTQDVSWADLAEAELIGEEHDLEEKYLDETYTNADAEEASVESSVTLDSVNVNLSRKRSFDEVDDTDSVAESDGPDKRPRVG